MGGGTKSQRIRAVPLPSTRAAAKAVEGSPTGDLVQGIPNRAGLPPVRDLQPFGVWRLDLTGEDPIESAGHGIATTTLNCGHVSETEREKARWPPAFVLLLDRKWRNDQKVKRRPSCICRGL